MQNSISEAQKLGQSVWYDNIRRGMIVSGELQRLVDIGVTGLTSNPTIFEKAVTGSADYDEALASLISQGADTNEIYENITMEDIQSAADVLRPVFDRTDGADGYASLEVAPVLAHDTEGTIEEAKRFYTALDRPNVLVKVPATPEGVPAIRSLIGQGVNVNVTLIFSLEIYRRVMDAYIGGLEDLAQSGGDVTKAASVASFFVSRVDGLVDKLLDEKIAGGEEHLNTLHGKAAVANAKMAYQAFKEVFGAERFETLRSSGARVQRPLWASTSTKNPEYSDVRYVVELMGADTVNTMPENTLTAFLEHGSAEPMVEEGLDEARSSLEALEANDIRMEQVTAQLMTEGVKSFADSFDALLSNIDLKAADMRSAQMKVAAAGLGSHLATVEDAVSSLASGDLVRRIWGRDHTVWAEEPTEIDDRLGWLDVAEAMKGQLADLVAFADEVRDEGFQKVVLLGMGGSSLGPEVLRRTFGGVSGYPELAVLDSTLPETVNAVGAGDLSRALFVVSSKSGTTTEPLTMYRHFRGLVDGLVGRDAAGRNFVCVTDPGTPLATLAERDGFRRTFEATPDLGGRYSVLSHFGLVPAALAGIDVGTLLDRALAMRRRCAASVSPAQNPGAWLGAAMGAMATSGRDKLTLVTSPGLSAFGLWAEQLIAESTGKDGKGILPVASEPLLDHDTYGDDRLFVHLRLDGDDNAANDSAMERVAAEGHPVIRLDLRDAYDLGAEFFRWEFATAVAGSILSINPFNQPSVQAAKDETERLLTEYRATGKLPDVAASDSLADLLSKASPGDYVALLAYLPEAPAIDEALGEVRARIARRYGVATTFGYGPRYLHSTGQLHKGGPDNGLFAVLTAPTGDDIPVPGETHTFGVLAEAQALGDLRALQGLGRRVARLQLGAEPAAGIAKLAIG